MFFWRYKDFVSSFWVPYLGVIFVAFQDFFLRSRYRGGTFFCVAKISNNFFRMLEILDVFLREG